jgi:AcrR family transcriptional regulator
MTVNGDSGHGRRTQAERSAATKDALISSARELFAERGFAGAGREDIVERAGVTRGALHHHFGGKEGLFLAVVESVHREMFERIATAAMSATDPMDQLRRGCAAFLDSAMDPAVRRIVLLDAPAVLGWHARREIDVAHALGLVIEGLNAAMDSGAIERRPVEVLAHLLLGALNEAAMLVANSDDPKGTRAVVGEAVDHLLDCL